MGGVVKRREAREESSKSRETIQSYLPQHFIYRSSKSYFTTTALHTISYSQQIAMQGHDAVLPMCISQSCNYSRVKVTID